MRAASAAAALTLLALALGSPAGAWHVPGIPTLDVVPFDSESYVAWRVHAPANTLFGVQVRAFEADTSFASFGLWDVDPQTLAFRGIINPAWYPEGGVALHLQLPGPVGMVASEDMGRVQAGHLLMMVDFEKFEAGESLLVAQAGFDGAVRGEIRLIGAEGVRVLGRTTGPAFLHHDQDFQGPAHAMARAGEPVRGTAVEAKATLDASAPASASERLFAHFTAGADLRTANVGIQEISYQGPDGGNSGRSWYLLHGAPPGDYAFRLDLGVDYRDNTPVCRGLAQTTCWRMPVWVLGSDTTLP
jgi:hypothetical protein